MPDFEIEALLQKVMGLKVTSIGKSTLDRSVQRRMKALAIDDKETYAKKLNSSALELRELIEEVVIPETWFFRDHEPFKAMTNFLVTQWAPKHKKNLFRVLSVPCSTGEEPYSLTMTLLDSGWPEDRFTVHGIDISNRSISKAKSGVYTENSFRGSDLSYRNKYFKKEGNKYILNSNVRKKVHFNCGNLLNNAFMQGLGLFDVIFFRNVLIYFDALSRHQAIATLYKILADDGILFVGHAEANLFTRSPFTPAQYNQAFAFYKKTKEEMLQESQKSAEPPQPVQKKKKGFAKRIFSFKKKPEKETLDLDSARSLADMGKLQQATDICEEHLDQFGPSAQAFFVLGIIRDADNDLEQAEKLFRKAVYLDPNHEEALFFLSLMAEKNGDTAELKALKKRIERLKKDRVSP